jgi:hypothetical protein
MATDEDVLCKINLMIGAGESDGDQAFLSEVLAPVLAFRRANGGLVDRATFLDGVKPSARRETKIESVVMHGQARAVVTCTVTVLDGAQRKQFHNLRLFVRSDQGAWHLLAWANEPI